MIHSTLRCSRTFPIALALVAGALSCSTASFGQSAPASTTVEPTPPTSADEIRLTDAQRMEILNNNTEDSAAAARGERLGPGLAGRGIHGEVGAMIGSYGSRSIYGVAEIPLGENAGAVVSFESSRFGYPRR